MIVKYTIDWQVKIISIILVMLASSNMTSDSRSQYAAYYRYFPYLEEFDQVDHFDKEIADRCRNLEFFKESCWVHMPLRKYERMLPPPLLQDYESFTAISASKWIYRKDFGPDALSDLTADELKERISKGERLVIGRDIGENMVVYRFSDLETPFRAAIKASFLEDTGRKISGAPVYRYMPPKEDREFYYCMTPTQELLCARYPETLKAMCAAGSGLEMGFLENDTAAYLLDCYSYLGQYWTAYNVRKNKISLRDQLIDGNYLEAYEKKLKHTLAETIENGLIIMCESWSIADPMIKDEIYVYGSSDIDEWNEYEPTRQSDLNRFSETAAQIIMLLEAARKEESHGNVQIQRYTFSEKMMESQRAYAKYVLENANTSPKE